MSLVALYTTISEQIVPPMAVAEAQGVILYFFNTSIASEVSLNANENFVPINRNF